MSVSRKTVEIIRDNNEHIAVIFQKGMKRLESEVLLDREYEIRVGHQSIGLTRNEFTVLYELMQDWWKPNDRP